MKAKKSKSHPQPTKDKPGYSVLALSKITGRDRKTIDKALRHIQPVRVEGRTKFYLLQDVEAALKAKTNSKLRDQKLIEEIRKLRLANDEREGKFILKSDVAASIRRCLTPMAATLEQRLVNEMPTSVGMDPPIARIYGKRLLDELLIFFQGFEKEWQ